MCRTGRQSRRYGAVSGSATYGRVTLGVVERKDSTKRSDEAPLQRAPSFPPGETVIAEARCRPGKWVTEGKSRLLVTVTTKRLVLLAITPHGDLSHEVPLGTIQSVESKTAYWFVGIPHVQIRVTCSDKQTLEFVSSGIGSSKARRLAKELSDRVEALRANEATPR